MFCNVMDDVGKQNNQILPVPPCVSVAADGVPRMDELVTACIPTSIRHPFFVRDPPRSLISSRASLIK